MADSRVYSSPRTGDRTPTPDRNATCSFDASGPADTCRKYLYMYARILAAADKVLCISRLLALQSILAFRHGHMAISSSLAPGNLTCTACHRALGTGGHIPE